MMRDFNNASVSIALLYVEPSPYGLAEFQDGLRSALAQDHPHVEVIVVDGRGAGRQPDFLPDDVAADSIRHLPGNYANRAAMLNAALRAAIGELLLVALNEQASVVLKKSAVTTMAMAACRSDGVTKRRSDEERTEHARRATVEGAGDAAVGLVYADYDRVETDGTGVEVHLLDWHEGRLRDTFDLGSVILFRTKALRELGGFDERYSAADLYDMRLRVSERYGVAHVASRFAGSLYSVAAPGKRHNVFDYLLSGKDAQLEMERACTEHLKRIGAYLAPGAHVWPVECSADESAGTGPGRYSAGDSAGAGPGRYVDGPSPECIASVVTPVNNRPEFIGRAIESVQAQTVRRVEMIVVVNGGEDDPTIDEVRRYMPGGDQYDADKPAVRLVVVDVNNLGLCLNAGISAARGKYYVQLDSDDRLKPDAVEKLLAVFESDPTVGMVVGSYEVWTLDDATGELRRNAEIPIVTHDEWTADNGRNNLLRINGAGAPRSAHIKAIAEAGWFGVNDTAHCRNYGEDYDLVLRISEQHTIGRVWEPIYEVIRHSGGTDHSIDQATIDRNDSAKDQMRLEALHRRRLLNRGEA